MIPVSQRSKEELREMTRKGGIASGKARRKKKELKKIAQMMVDVPIAGKNRDKLIELGFPEEALNRQWALYIAGLMSSATKGNEKAFAKLQELTGEETSNYLLMKEKELELKERELVLKEKELEARLNPDIKDDGVRIINDLYEDDKTE